MFRVTHTFRLRRLPRLRDLYPRAVRALERRIEQNVVPRVIADLPMIASYPGPAVYPFQFATDKSRRFYFWKYRGQIPYLRTGALAADWSVIANGQLGGGVFNTLTALVRSQRLSGTLTIDVFNSSPYGTYVYGPRQVPGHAATGWDEQVNNSREAFINRMAEHVVEEWSGAVQEAIDN